MDSFFHNRCAREPFRLRPSGLRRDKPDEDGEKDLFDDNSYSLPPNL